MDKDNKGLLGIVKERENVIAGLKGKLLRNDHVRRVGAQNEMNKKHRQELEAARLQYEQELFILKRIGKA